MSRSFTLIAALVLSACSAPVDDVVDLPSAPAVATVVADSLVRELPARLYSATVVYAQLENGGPMTAAINAELRSDAQALMDEFPAVPADEVRDAIADGMPSMATVDLHGSYEVDRLDARVLSLNRTHYAFTGGAHGNYWFDPVTFDLSSGDRIELSDIVNTDGVSLSALSAAVERSLRRQGWDLDEGWGDGFGPDADNFQAFTLVPDSLVFHFSPYQIGPYAAGSFRAPIAFSELQSVLANDAPVR